MINHSFINIMICLFLINYILSDSVRHQLQTPGTYQQLAAFYEDKKGLLPLSVTNDNESAQTKAIVSNPGSDENDFPDMTVIACLES